MSLKISVLGCGWLGLPLAKQLVSKGYLVKGSTRLLDKSSQLEEVGVKPFIVQLEETEANIPTQFLDSDVLILSVPPQARSKGPDFHINQLKQLVPIIEKSPIQWVIYTSSTSIYPANNQAVDEAFELTDSQHENQTIYQAEKLLSNNSNFDTTILRLAGLYGPNRTLIKHFTGKFGLTNGNTPVNFVHQQDVVNAICEVIAQDKRNKVYNICSDEHPTRKAFYNRLSKEMNISAPQYIDGETPPFKLIANTKLKTELDFEYSYPDPLQFPVH